MSEIEGLEFKNKLAVNPGSKKVSFLTSRVSVMTEEFTVMVIENAIPSFVFNSISSK